MPEIRMGDVALFSALIDALDLAPAWKRRLVKDFNRKSNLAADLDRLTLETTQGVHEYQGVLSALNGAAPQAAHALVKDLVAIAGFTTGGRDVDEIADRVLEQAALGGRSRLPQETRSLIEKFLAVAGDPDSAVAELRALMADAKIDLGAVLDLFESRTGFLVARGVDVRRIRFATALGSGWDYYSGLLFKLNQPGGDAERPLVAGGRYDGMLTRLGSPKPVPAVGFAVWIERLEAAGGTA
jgi:ATP phosphoribosyltransferase regulatory subunit